MSVGTRWRTPNERERQILRWLATGAGNDEIGRQLYLAPETIKTYLAAMFRRYGAANRAHLVAIAIRARWIE